ncbi:MAG: hypothetical protein ACHREM_19710 [Polyangiales bacterium]
MRRRLTPSFILAAVLVAIASVVLVRHARRFDFVCDDAYIALRYAKNWGDLGAPVYNPGQRVEGYTSFLFTALTALVYKLGIAPPSGAQLIGALSGIGILAASYALWLRVERRTLLHQGLGGAFVVAMLAVSAPVAAWTMGGLETPLFTALATFSLVLAADLAAVGDKREGAIVGAVLALATLTRPEGALFTVAAGLVLLVARARDATGRRAIAGFVLAYLMIAGGFEAWRWSYYGYPLPNTFYVKSTGAGDVLRARGVGYVNFAADEIGRWIIGISAFALLMPARPALAQDNDVEGTSLATRRRAALWMMWLVPIPYVAYVVNVGGDFLDLYRFFVPLFPLAFVAIAAAIAHVGERVTSLFAEPKRARASLVVAVACTALAAQLLARHRHQQIELGDRAMQVAEPERGKRNLEPLGWTQLYARKWAAMGRWIAAHAKPGDTMAAGAAGAMPYFAGIPSLDLFGLCDAFIAHDGLVIGSRPGHQRTAPQWYIVEKKPTFLVINSEELRDFSMRPWNDAYWRGQGWVRAEAKMPAGKYGFEKDQYFGFLLKRERAEAMRGEVDVAIADF